MEKVTLLIRGNLICKEILLGGGKSDLVTCANENDYDISEAIVVDGDVNLGVVACSGIILVTGDVILNKKEYYGNNTKQ